MRRVRLDRVRCPEFCRALDCSPFPPAPPNSDGVGDCPPKREDTRDTDTPGAPGIESARTRPDEEGPATTTPLDSERPPKSKAPLPPRSTIAGKPGASFEEPTTSPEDVGGIFIKGRLWACELKVSETTTSIRPRLRPCKNLHVLRDNQTCRHLSSHPITYYEPPKPPLVSCRHHFLSISESWRAQ